MGEEFTRWLEAAQPAWPVALGALALLAVGGAVTAFLLRRRWIAARASERRAEHLWHNIDCVVEPTQALDMRPLVAHPDKARFNPAKVLVHLRERRSVGDEFVPPADWTSDELAVVKSMTDRSGWPNTTYRPRGVMPRLRRYQPAPVVVTPAVLGARIKRIRDEQKRVKPA